MEQTGRDKGEVSMGSRIVAENIRLKRAYDAAHAGDGTRILVDRLWPRGVRKVDAAIDLWARDIAPSTGLRKWFGHNPTRWHEFRRRYSEEMRQHRDRLGELRALAQGGRITLVFAAHDTAHNDAVVLREILLGRSVSGASHSRAHGRRPRAESRS
jgi:uncharacterized protein YeaO (DUF488 family)